MEKLFKYLIVSLMMFNILVVHPSIQGQEGSIYEVATGKDYYAAVYTDGTIRIWDVTTNQLIFTIVDTSQDPARGSVIEDPGDPIDDLDFSPNSNLLAVSYTGTILERAGAIRIFDMNTGEMTIEFPNSFGLTSWNHPGDIAWDPTGTLLAARVTIGSGYTTDRRVVVWDITDQPNAPLVEYDLRSDASDFNIAWSPSGNQLVTADDLSLYLWNTSEWVPELGVPLPTRIFDVAWNVDGSRIAGVDAFGTVYVIDPVTEQVLMTLPGTSTKKWWRTVIWSDSNKIITNNDDQVLVWNGTTGELINTIEALNVVSIALLPGDQLLLARGPFTPTEPEIIPVISTPPITCDFTIATGDSAGLVAAIDTANGNGTPSTICVEGLYTFTAANNSTYGGNALPLIDSDITIVGTGGGATLQRDLAAPNFRFFYVDSDGTLTLNNLIIQNADVGSSNGGAIYTIGVLNINNSTLSNNTTTGAGGAIRSSGGTLTIIDSVLDGNSANNGGAIRNSTSPFTITNTTLSNNTANGYGGAIYTSGGITLTDSTLSSNTSTNYGGAIYNSAGTATITGSTFEYNQGKSGALHFVGGLPLAEVTNSTFDSNTATSSCGGIRTSSATTLNGTTFMNNQANDDGGALCSFDDLTITNGIVSANSANDLGGGLILSGGVVVISGTVVGNNTARLGGGVFNNGSAITLTGNLVSNNIATDKGAGIFNEAGSLAISGSTFDSNQATILGGGITNGTTLTVVNSIFTNNSSNNGGAIYNDSSAANWVEQTCISGNTASTGSGVYSLTANFDATDNWWGATDGPSESGTGSGDGVNGNVLFSPYLGACPN